MVTRSFHRGTLAALAALAAILGAERADAYCQSRTCTGANCPRDEDGCKTTGEALWWRSRCVSFSLQKDGTENLSMDEVRPAVEESFLAWTDLACDTGTASIAFSEAPMVSCHATEYNPGQPNANIVLFQDTKWEYKGVDNNLAKTTVTFDTGTGEIFDADIELNFAFNELTVGEDHVVYDLQAILTHEIGHFIGLDHTPDPDATMFSGYEEGTIEQRTLEADDLAAVCAAYPPEREAICDPDPLGGLGDECLTVEEEDPASGGGCGIGGEGAGSGGAGALAVIAMAAGASAIRRRRKKW